MDIKAYKQSLIDDIDDLITKLECKKQEIKEIQENRKFLPIHDEYYWYVDDCGNICKTPFHQNCYSDIQRVDIGNCFKTKEEAELYAKKIIEVFSNGLNEDKKLGIYDKFGFIGYLGDETHITYENGITARVGDVVDVIQKDSIRKYRTYIFKDDDYTKGAIMGYASPTSNQRALNNFYGQYEIHKIIDYSRLKEGYIYSNDKAEIRAIIKGDCDNE
ncbi:hypothetical protein PMX22_10065 [Clostridium butyricum]|uniref:hypothetical protein n=1 Tax=Clostridium butyricum TaxID=1492 RepID=UPI00232FF582|nr:hypothetical protein [Clostridium butyricum]MDB2160146.1 hypothetical protein [Clostridium butyricum]